MANARKHLRKVARMLCCLFPCLHTRYSLVKCKECASAMYCSDWAKISARTCEY